MKRNSWLISRRTVLRTAGSCIALPVLEAMIKPGARAETVVPKRLIGVFGQHMGYVGRADPYLTPRGTLLSAPWTAQTPGQSVPLANNTYLKPFFDRSLQSKITVLLGITDRVTHGSHVSPVKLFANTFPVGIVKNGSALLADTAGSDTIVGPPPRPDPFNGATIDQIAASQIGKNMAIPYLSLGVQKLGFGGDYSMSYKSRTEPVANNRNPRAVWQLLTQGSSADATKEEALRRKAYRKSILDGVREDAASLRSRLGKSDANKLDGYLDSVRSLELLIDRISPPPNGKPPPAQPPVSAPPELVQIAMQELAVYAFATDATRVIGLSTALKEDHKARGPTQSALDFSQFRSFNGAPMTFNHHGSSHTTSGQLIAGFNQEESIAYKRQYMDIYTHWQLELFARLLKGLNDLIDVDGNTVLDNTVALWGGDNSDCTRHGFLSQPCIIGGRGGRDAAGWKILSGRQLRFVNDGNGLSTSPLPTERGWKDVLWGILNILGVTLPDGSPLTHLGYARHRLDQDLR